MGQKCSKKKKNKKQSNEGQNLESGDKNENESKEIHPHDDRNTEENKWKENKPQDEYQYLAEHNKLRNKYHGDNSQDAEIEKESKSDGRQQEAWNKQENEFNKHQPQNDEIERSELEADQSHDEFQKKENERHGDPPQKVEIEVGNTPDEDKLQDAWHKKENESNGDQPQDVGDKNRIESDEERLQGSNKSKTKVLKTETHKKRRKRKCPIAVRTSAMCSCPQLCCDQMQPFPFKSPQICSELTPPSQHFMGQNRQSVGVNCQNYQDGGFNNHVNYDGSNYQNFNRCSQTYNPDMVNAPRSSGFNSQNPQVPEFRCQRSQQQNCYPRQQGFVDQNLHSSHSVQYSQNMGPFQCSNNCNTPNSDQFFPSYQNPNHPTLTPNSSLQRHLTCNTGCPSANPHVPDQNTHQTPGFTEQYPHGNATGEDQSEKKSQEDNFPQGMGITYQESDPLNQNPPATSVPPIQSPGQPFEQQSQYKCQGMRRPFGTVPVTQVCGPPPVTYSSRCSVPQSSQPFAAPTAPAEYVCGTSPGAYRSPSPSMPIQPRPLLIRSPPTTPTRQLRCGAECPGPRTPRPRKSCRKGCKRRKKKN